MNILSQAEAIVVAYMIELERNNQENEKAVAEANIQATFDNLIVNLDKFQAKQAKLNNPPNGYQSYQ